MNPLPWIYWNTQTLSDFVALLSWQDGDLRGGWLGHFGSHHQDSHLWTMSGWWSWWGRAARTHFAWHWNAISCLIFTVSHDYNPHHQGSAQKYVSSLNLLVCLVRLSSPICICICICIYICICICMPTDQKLSLVSKSDPQCLCNALWAKLIFRGNVTFTF